MPANFTSTSIGPAARSTRSVSAFALSTRIPITVAFCTGFSFESFAGSRASCSSDSRYIDATERHLSARPVPCVLASSSSITLPTADFDQFKMVR